MMAFPEGQNTPPEGITPNAVQRNYSFSIAGGLNDCAGAGKLLCATIQAVKDGQLSLEKAETHRFCERSHIIYVRVYER